jgi:hypothetical protein
MLVEPVGAFVELVVALNVMLGVNGALDMEFEKLGDALDEGGGVGVGVD